MGAAAGAFGGSIISAYLSSRATKKAAQSAADAQIGSAQLASDTQMYFYEDAARRNLPYELAGYDALAQLTGMDYSGFAIPDDPTRAGASSGPADYYNAGVYKGGGAAGPLSLAGGQPLDSPLHAAEQGQGAQQIPVDWGWYKPGYEMAGRFTGDDPMRAITGQTRPPSYKWAGGGKSPGEGAIWAPYLGKSMGTSSSGWKNEYAAWVPKEYQKTPGGTITPRAGKVTKHPTYSAADLQGLTQMAQSQAFADPSKGSATTDPYSGRWTYPDAVAGGTGIPTGGQQGPMGPVRAAGVPEGGIDPTGGSGAYRDAIESLDPTLRARLQESFGVGPDVDPLNALYEWEKEQGEEAINRMMSARGKYNSGTAIEALSEYNRALSAEESQRRYGRAVDEYGRQYGQQFDLFNMTQSLADKRYGKVMDVLKLGTGASASMNQAGMRTGENISSTQLGAGNVLASAELMKGQAGSQMWSGVGGAVNDAFNRYYNQQQPQGGPMGGYYDMGPTDWADYG